MATGNFLNHKNGIFVICNYDFDDTKKDLLENGDYTDDKLSDESVYEEMNFCAQEEFDNFFDCFGNYISDHYDLVEQKNYVATVYNKTGKLVAELALKSGYYSAAQVVVETDFELLAERYLDYDYERGAYLKGEYTPHHKRLIKMLAEYTTPIVCIGVFSSGEAVYQKAS